MTIDLTRYLDDSQPKYLAIARALSRAIRAGELTPGTRLPPHRTLAELLGVSVQTVSRAYAQAEKMGLVRSRVGSGTWINVLDDSRESAYLRNGELRDADQLIDMSIAHPVCPADHHDRFRRTLMQIAEHSHPDIVTASRPIAGLVHHRERANAWLTSQLCMPGDIDDRILCNGAAHGLMLAISSVVQHGDLVLTEALTDHGLIALSRTLGFQLRGVPVDELGVMPDALDAACHRFKPRAVCLTPTQLNPTGATMDATRRDEIAAVLERHGVWLIEDDVHALLESPGLMPISARIPHQGFHVTSLTKVTVPGLRTGYVTVPRGQLHHTLPRLRATCWMAPPLMFEIADRWIEDGTVNELALIQRQLLAERQQLAAGILRAHPLESRPTSLHVWLTLPNAWRAEELQQLTEQEGLAITTASPFMVEQTPPPRRIRLSLGAEPDIRRLEEGLQRLAELLEDSPPPMMQIVY
ncbi:PLP-dependent aminotransferase family protein [Halomonas huangheensis]|uniref:GntR family transcriptional regulator n=1 Tax=Halomonas huangheensis TaxID=1178482 RepID=W1NAE7_9GAMM|nr:PLP-dependent aminotransferase family protein [Halomonas huangheensis]ALM53446.1 GntR family transcriptional regulator [Halomonas huangheensis]ERL51880.1 GntR family transcriptional regulator [Halomonas huangheensis]